MAEEALKVAEARTKAAEDALRAAQERFGKESEKAAEAGKIAIETARAEVVQAKATAEAARAEAVAKIEAAAKASKEQVDAAKKTAAEAVEKLKNAEDKVKSADIRANLAESKAKEIEESLNAETAAKEAAEEAKEKAEQIAKDAKAQAELEKQKANDAKIEANEAKSELAKAEAALEVANKALADALASGGNNTAALQAEVDRRQAALDAANAKATAAEQAQAAATAAAEAQVAVANQAAKDAKDALAASQIKNAPETKKTGVQHVSIDASGLGQGALTTTTRDFGITDATQVQARADIASGGLVSDPVALKVSGANDAAVAGSNGFKSFENTTKVVTASLGEQDLVYTSTYKDFGDDLRVAHIDGTAAGLLPVNGVAVVGNATQVINMPTEGKVGYTGDATYREIGLGKDIQFGTSVFTADFVAKNLKGDLTFSNKTIGLEAAILGNQFSGSKDGYNADGGFYGGDAQYLGGVYEGNGAQGTYGAKSNKQTAAEQAAVKAQADADKANAAIAAVQAAADKAQAAATKAQADATKAQEALAAAEDALANAGNGQDQLALALERAALAEAAQAAALEAASKAETAKEAALLAQSSAEAAATAAQVAADKAIGEAKIEADKKVATANQQAADARAQAADAEVRAEKAKTAAADAKTRAEEAEDRAQAAEDALAAEKELPPAPANPQAPVNTKLSGFQNTISGSDNSAINANNSSSYDKLKVLLVETGSGRYDNKTTTEFALRNVADQDYLNGFKKSSLYSLPAGYLNRTFKYTSVYKNYDDQMQIGHLYGDLKTSNNGTRLDTLSNVYVQGNGTNAEDMQYMKTLSQYNIDNGVNDGKVKYEGDATYLKNDQIIGNDPSVGTSKFSVDFVDQQVDGTLSFTDVGVKKVKAEITGNTFAGNWNGLDTKGGFFGEDAGLLGGVYQDGSGKGTYGATKVLPAAEEPFDPTVVPVNPDAAANSDATGIMSNTLSSQAGLGTSNAIGFRKFITDNETYKTTRGSGEDEAPIIIKDSKVDNLTYYAIEARLDIVKPNKFNTAKQDFTLTTVRADDVAVANTDSFKKSSKANEVLWKEVNTGVSVSPTADLTLPYQSVYKNFDSQMQIGHVYGDLDKRSGIASGIKSRYANVYVVGNSTAQEDMDYLKAQARYDVANGINDGIVQYAGVATYADNLHLAAGGPMGLVLNGTSTFDVNFVNDSLTGNLAFAGDKNIGINANITGNTFAGTNAANNVATAGGFYGEDAKFLGGIYQEARPDSSVPGTGTDPGTGTTFQGTFGAEKQ